jgi:D-sedoheptulose 7-phosphate isomerase
MEKWVSEYIASQKSVYDSIPVDEVTKLIEKFRDVLRQDRKVFIFGNGGSAASASHFATDLGKGASRGIGKYFKVMSLNDNVSWMTALANDDTYEDVFVGQLKNYSSEGDIAFSMSVSGNSPSCVQALTWARNNGLETIALVGANKGVMAEIAHHVIVVNDRHYGRVEDAHMTICHLLCYAFMENLDFTN